MESTSTKTTRILLDEFRRELESEARATRECLQNVPMDKPDWKPHDKSMQLGYLAILTADIPRWIQFMIEHGTIDLKTFGQKNPQDADELVALFDANLKAADKALDSISDADLTREFQLKNDGQLLFASPLGETISQSINHMVHHRGQLTVYLRLNDETVPSIYGPSADSGGF